MGRPSLLEAKAEKRGGIVTATYIGGRCVPVMRGRSIWREDVSFVVPAKARDSRSPWRSDCA